ncbi:hypothetical protein [Alkalihalobacillus sp. 1P02AB]
MWERGEEPRRKEGEATWNVGKGKEPRRKEGEATWNVGKRGASAS